LAARPQIPYTVRTGGKSLIFKCPECGNTFKVEKLAEDNVVVCPICEADYTVVVESGKARLTEYVYEKEDFGELS
jgi:lysine biosynthesis protein LysW